MQPHQVPYGEARRLRYFTCICRQLLDSPALDRDLLIGRLAALGAETEPKLKSYIRITGVMRTRAVASNYLKFATWLGLVRSEASLVLPNAYTKRSASVCFVDVAMPSQRIYQAPTN